MRFFNKTTVLLGVALALVFVAGGVYTFFFVAMKNKTQATAELSERLEELSGKTSHVLFARASLKNEEANIEKLGTYFIKERDIISFTKKIETLGSQSGTNLTLEALEPGFSEKTVPYLNFRIKASGEFSNIARLLMLLENLPGKFEWKTVRLIRDDSATLQSAASTGKEVSRAPAWTVEVFLTALNFVKE